MPIKKQFLAIDLNNSLKKEEVMKKGGHLESLLAVVVIVFLLQIIDVRSASATEKTPSTPQTPLLLKVSIWTPGHVPYARAASWILEEVEKRNKGRIKFEYYYSGSLIPPKEIITGLKAAVADVALVPPMYSPGKLPLCEVTFLPMIGQHFYSTAMALSEIMQSPEFKEELNRQNIRYLGPNTNAPQRIWMKKSVRSLAEIKGKKIRAVGDYMVLIKDLGMVPIGIVTTEAFTALERGTLDGVMFDPIAAFTYKFIEVAPYCYNMLFGNGTCFLGINKDSWNKIPADIQKMFTDLHEEAVRQGHIIYEVQADKNMEEGKAKGIITVIEPTAEDVALAVQVAKNNVWKNWIEQVNKRNLPGQKVLDNWTKLVEKWEARSPFKK